MPASVPVYREVRVVLSVCETRANAMSRMIAIRLASVTLRCMENWRRVAGGPEEAMIMLAMVAITADRLLREPVDDEFKDLRVPLPHDQLAKCNIASIAEATGINRETVRRKLALLVARGAVVRKPDGGYLFASSFLQQDIIVDTIRQQLDSLRGMTENFVHEGVFKLSG